MSEDESLAIADAEVEHFIARNIHARSVTQREPVRAAVLDFVRRQVALNPACRFAVVTAGGTVAPLEKKEIRHVTNLSTGQRAAISAEWFLRHDYRVIYFHKTGCLLPFARHFQDGSFLDKCAPTDNGKGAPRLPDDELGRAAREHHHFAVATQSIMRVPFHTVADYQLGMKTILQAVREANESLGRRNVTTLVYLVAAVSDFYIPFDELPNEKIDSRPNDPNMTLFLSKVPKALARGLVGRVWGADAFVTTFKLETDESRIDHKVMQHINGFSNIRVVVSNVLEEIRTQVTVRDTRRPEDKEIITKLPDSDLEEALVGRVVGKHSEYVDGRW